MCCSVQSLGHVWLFVTPWTAALQASLSITNSWSLLKLMSIDLVMPFNHLILCCPLLFLLSIFPNLRVFSNESVLRIRWPNDWCFSISPSNGYSGLISFRIDWLDLLAVQGTLKSLLQHHSSKASILQLSAFFMVQLSCADLREMLCLEISPSSSPLATWCEKPIHGKRPWCWERLRAGGEGGDRGWDG